MFRHPVTIIGYIVVAFGFFTVLGGGASRVGIDGPSIINFQVISIGSCLIIIGCMLILSGIAARGINTISSEMRRMTTALVAIEEYERRNRADASRALKAKTDNTPEISL